MGLVKFGNLTLTVDQIPDGHIVISQSELETLRNTNNAYLSLRSKIPVGVDENQLASLAQKGQQYDAIAQQLAAEKTASADLKTKVDKFSNMPSDFSAEKWNNYVNQEKSAIRAKKIGELTKQVFTEHEQKTGQKVSVDEVFLNHPSVAAEVAAFDPAAADAKDKWALILNKAHTAQEEFVLKTLNGTIPDAGGIGSPVTASGSPRPAGQPETGPKDVVTDGASKLQRI